MTTFIRMVDLTVILIILINILMWLLASFSDGIRWAFAGKVADVCYWLSALAITATVTFLYGH
jgi:hypothetical protein